MAVTVITAANIANMLVPGIKSITSNYPYYFNEWKMIYTILPSVKSAEVDIEVSTLSGASQFAEGASMPMGSMKQAFITNTKMKNFGIGFMITAIAIEDNLYPDQFPKGMLGIKENLNILSEYQGIALFDNAFSTANPEYVLGDGQSMCSFNHPIANGVVSNTIQPAELNETSAEDLIKTIQYFKDYSGLPRKILPKTYLVGIQNQFTVQILTGSTYKPFDATNGINPLSYGEYLQGGFILSHYMANPTNWFLLTSFKEGLVHYLRKSLEITMNTDQSNRNIGVYGNERYAPRCTNFRSVAGVQAF